MTQSSIGYAILLDSTQGRFLMPRQDSMQPGAVLRTGKLHIETEIQKLLTIVEALGSGACMLDVGANIGLVSVPCARALAATGGKVIAFEAQRIVYYLLAANCALNGLQNLFCHHLAVSDRDELLRIPEVDYLGERDFGTVSFVEAPLLAVESAALLPTVGKETVRALSIDAMGLERLDFVKVDVEGMELRILAGAKKTIARHRPMLWVEYWLDPQGICDAVLDLGYEVWLMDDFNLLAIPEEKVGTLPFVPVGDPANRVRASNR